MTQLQRTPLYDHHRVLQAKMVPFGGWEMPVQYDGIIAEYLHTRSCATVFDISHMGEFIIEGDLKESGLDRLVTMSLNDLAPKSSRYGVLLNEHGGIVDDLIFFRLGERKWFVVVNAATMEKDAAHFRKHLTKQALFLDVSSQTGKLDLQGPKSRDVLSGYVKDIEKLDYFTFDYFDLLGENVLISRTGYTGELGYEIFYPWNKTAELWTELLRNKDVKPAGLGARDVLRLEMGYSLYGHELNEDISPLEAGLERFVDFKKDFIGKEALLQQKSAGLKKKIVGFISDSRRSPREGHRIFSDSEQEIGFVTSGSYSPSLERGIGLGYTLSDYVQKDRVVFFGDDKQRNSAKITGRTFYNKSSLKN